MTSVKLKYNISEEKDILSKSISKESKSRKVLNDSSRLGTKSIISISKENWAFNFWFFKNKIFDGKRKEEDRLKRQGPKSIQPSLAFHKKLA